MRIAYKKRHLNVNLILGLVWAIAFFAQRFTEDSMKWTDYFWLVLSLTYLGIYVYQKQYKYIRLEKGIIKICSPFGKQMELDKIQKIKKFAGDYILKGQNKELTINTQIIDPKSLLELDTALQQLNVEWM
ncbi:hypothetical protein [Flagellimonas aequoris]|uniref:Uncharacterized protein n=1 Tax=Flagellimonas aequoris TaxID=2306997 RepID=A0A418N274_9FLAO|nr:hypothetical protein [Allomuricauda aequoris]RIV67420.1 hypothetical protein D2U88_17910 [Allomuricauda aequoris]TXJ99242.1 hypothetical protein FQ019_17700 [Allomuricauda aequoris]